ncbi:TraB domain-containing protein [Haloprofundus salinisoli]|uniref:TraB domain-containing protein n=1 Tax=Haloprofundus salinisoli TaxID=2876193 RepID=UPI001CCF056B|nr:TraB/GumN family protein [Haloprofundus salinisoli]
MVHANDDTGTVVLVGTVHVTEESGENVRRAIERHDPDVVTVELCSMRLRHLYAPNTTRQKLRNLAESYRSLSRSGFALNVLFKLSQQSYNDDTGVDRDDRDMFAAIDAAESSGRRIAAIDRPIEETLDELAAVTRSGVNDAYASTRRRLDQAFEGEWGELASGILVNGTEPATGLAHLLGLHFWYGTLTADGPAAKAAVMERLSPKQVASFQEALERIAPEFVRVMIRERDAYMARRLEYLRQQGDDVVAVVGKAHVEGIRRHFEDGTFAADAEKPPFVSLRCPGDDG